MPADAIYESPAGILARRFFLSYFLVKFISMVLNS